MAIFHDVKKVEIFFPFENLFYMFVNEEIVFEEYIDMELKIFFRTSKGFFEKQK